MFSVFSKYRRKKFEEIRVTKKLNNNVSITTSRKLITLDVTGETFLVNVFPNMNFFDLFLLYFEQTDKIFSTYVYLVISPPSVCGC